MLIYLMGSLSNQEIPILARKLKDDGFDVFADWFASGPNADSHWKAFHKSQGLSYKETLASPFVQHAFDFDFKYLQKADVGVLVMNGGKSAHLELGWMLGQGKKGYIYFPDGEPDRPDLMAKLASDVCFGYEELMVELRTDKAFRELAQL